MKKFPSMKSNREYQVVYNRGKSYGNKALVMYILKNNKEYNRLGISVSKKVGNSIVRHRMARIIREIFRLNNDKILEGYDIIIIFRVTSVGMDYKKIEDAYIHLCKLHGLLK